MSFAREGYPFIGAAALFAGTAWTGVLVIGGWSLATLAVILSVLAVFVPWFFRDPRRTAPGAEELVVAPGEGRVIDIDEVDEPTFLRSAARRIAIFLSVFDVHVQRAPLTGTVEHREYVPGRYQAAWLDKASEHNERASLGITTPQGRVLVRQIAGLVARRIVTDPSEGDRVRRGERIGLIRFGSRVELFVPLDWEITCEVGDRVRVGSTPLARLPARVEA